ncbi:MAG: diguanylate cyclase [Fibromonadaceae bacterium]|jgi:diguanylate cyclase (GGDEF)-like protein|nr:diguanylate cyclase [Fibromonadaceae bacterium]
MSKKRKNTLLIVDDEKSSLMALTHILEPEYNILAAKDGNDAIEVAVKHLPDVILLDIVMPEINGYEVIDILKKTEKTCDIPIIFVTGMNDVQDEERGLALGAADYISKPFSPAIVKLRVHNQIQILEQLRIIKQLSLIDQLTHIPNRRSFDEHLSQEWSRAIRHQAIISILMIDIDRFKNYNDTYGHQQGDTALKAVAEIFKKVLRRSVDFAARWGGEEFAVLLPDTAMDKALKIAEQIRARIEKLDIPLTDGTTTKVTLSVGVNTQLPKRDCSIEDFIKCSDRALYTAKQTGRNKVCSYSEV